MHRLTVVANDVRRIPLADPLLLELLERGKRFLPRLTASVFACEHDPQRLTNQPATGTALSPRSPVYLLQQLVGERYHDLGHCPSSSGVSLHDRRKI